jgi:hypothetical protein
MVGQLMDVLRELVLPRLEGLRPAGGGFMARCPAHEDGKASLSVSAGKDHPVLFHCHAGCDRDSVLEKLGLTWEQVCESREDRPRAEWTPRGDAVAVYDYVDEDGNLLFQVCRTANKEFPQRRPDSSKPSGWNWKLGEVRRVPYRLPKLLEALESGHAVWIVEGEKDVHSLERKGAVATCSPGGAGKWKPEYDGFFVEADVTIVADKDGPGEKHARTVAAALQGVASSVRIVEAKVGKDATDHLEAGYTLEEFIETWTGSEATKLHLAQDLWEFIGHEDAPHDWVVPGLLERGDRLIWTGFEGLGKSMFVRQLAVTVAAGLDPFRFTSNPTRNVLLIDCENSESQGRRRFRPLAAASIKFRHRVPDGGLRLIHRPEGLDLLRDDDASWLLERVTAHKPDLLMIGPFYRLHASNINDEVAARKTVAVLDHARAKVDCALVVEAHAGHGEHGMNRSVRPVGSSLLLRWPEFGYGIKPFTVDHDGKTRHVRVEPWRGDRDERDWPNQLVWGDPWPWQLPMAVPSSQEWPSRYEPEDREDSA